MPTMTQCRLERGLDHRREVQIAWIESKFARIDRVVDIKEDGEMSKGWTVMRIGSTQDAKVIQERSRDHLRHRVATDI